jgi:DnaK suppressor protein
MKSLNTQSNNQELNKTSLEEIKKTLLKKKQEILNDLKNIKSEASTSVDFPEYGDKVDENVQEIDEYTKNLATDKVLENSLRDIDNALERIEKGNYGICKYCKKPINKKRLLARPVASACVECKTKLQNNI